MSLHQHSVVVADILNARRRLLSIGWLAAVIIPAFYLSLFPSMESLLAGFSDLPEAMEAVIGDVDIATPKGFFASEVLAITGPLLIAAVAISLGTGLVASEHDRTLSSLFFSPFGRSRLAAAHVATLVLGVVVTCGLLFVSAVVTSQVAQIELALGAVASGVVPLVAFGLFSGSIAFFAAAATGSPGAGTGAGWGGLLLALLANSAGQLVDGAQWLSDASPWGWYGGGAAVTDGVDLVGSGLLLGGAAAFAALGAVAFDRRDLRL